MRNEQEIEWLGKTQRKKPRIGIMKTRREEKPMKRIMQHIEDEEEALDEIEMFLNGEYEED